MLIFSLVHFRFTDYKIFVDESLLATSIYFTLTLKNIME
ncbi:hypothetical protein [Enterobacter hormaechei]|nr:hypothetical protein [Enterobacter hormaechei]